MNNFESFMNVFDLEPGETKIDTWTAVYLGPDGSRYNGKLTVTNKRLLFDAKFDISIQSIIDETLILKSDTEEFLVIPKDRISRIDTRKSFIKKQIILTLDNGQTHTFDYGMLNIDKIDEAIRMK